ncbi:MAG: Ser/Thr protein phosphatase family protein [Pseudomonas sp.]|nr:Ser/Thr protein phosphatase family protein [Pseudomonas sp.]
MFHLYLGLLRLRAARKLVSAHRRHVIALDGLQVVQLTDLHISRLFHATWVSEAVARTNALNPDLILITGDLLDGTTTARRQDVVALGELKAALGVVAIPFETMSTTLAKLSGTPSLLGIVLMFICVGVQRLQNRKAAAR